MVKHRLARASCLLSAKTFLRRGTSCSALQNQVLSNPSSADVHSQRTVRDREAVVWYRGPTRAFLLGSRVPSLHVGAQPASP